MDTRKIQEMVHRELQRYLPGSSPDDPDGPGDPSNSVKPGNSLLIVLNRIDPLLPEALYQLRKLEDAGTRITLLLPDGIREACQRERLLPMGNFETMGDADLPGLLLNPVSHYMLLFPVAGFALAKAIAELSDEKPYVDLALSYIKAGKTVGIVVDSIELSGKNIAAPRLKSVSDELKKDLSGTGIRLIRLVDLAGDMTVKRDLFGGKIVTETTVVDFHKNDIWDINIRPSVVVTPLAKDKAKELGIRINRVE